MTAAADPPGQRIAVRWADHGLALVEELVAALDELQAGDPLAEVVLVVPPGATAGTLRRLLPGAREGRGVAGVRFTTPVDLALELGPAELARRRPITPQLLAAAVRAELSGPACPQALEPVRAHRSTLDALVRAAERLRNVHVAEDAERVLAAVHGGNAVRRAIVEVAVRARRTLVAAGFRDEPGVLDAATRSLRSGVRVLDTPVLVVSSDAVHPGQLPFLETLVRTAPHVAVVAVRPDPTDDALAGQITRLAGGTVERRGAIGVPDQCVSAPDQDEEVRAVVRRVLALLGGTAPVRAERIAVLHPPAGGHARRVTDELTRAGILWNGPAPGTLAESIAGTVLRLLLDCLDRSDRETVLHLLDTAPLWPTTRATRRPVASWRARCRELALVTEADWARAADRLERQLDEQRLRFGTGADDPDRDERDERARRQLAQLLEVVGEIRTARARLIAAHGWREAVDILLRLLARHIGDETWRAANWEGLPVWQQRAAAQIVDRCRALDVLDDEAFRVPYRFADLPALVATLADAPLGRQGDPAVGVRVLGLSHGLCLDADHVFVVGVNDGVLPSAPADDLIVRPDLPDACTAWIEPADFGSRRLARAWSSLVAGPARVTASYARSDLRRGGELYPSTWLAAFVEQGAVEHHRSHADGLDTGPWLTANEAVRAGAERPELRHEVLRRRALALASRRQASPTEYDGNIGAVPGIGPTTRIQSITRFETLAVCGTSYLMRYVLGVPDRTDAAEITAIESRDRGDLVHHVLERIVVEWLAIPEPDRPRWLGPEHRPVADALAVRLVDERANALRMDHRLGHETSWRLERAMLLRAIGGALDDDVASGCVPLAAEHTFGVEGGPPAALIDTLDGLVRFTGKIDRIDRVGGTIRVTDFKTTSSNDPKTPSANDPTEGGTKLQLPVYSLVAARDFGAPGDDVPLGSARYVFLARDQCKPKPLPATAHERFREDIEALAHRLAIGDLRPGAPHEVWGCSTCSPDRLGLDAVASRVNVWAAAPDEEEPA